MSNKYKAHQELIERLNTLCGIEFRDELRLFSRITGTFYARRVDNGLISYIRYKFSKNGQADLYGVYRLKINDTYIPLKVEIEIKTGKAVLNKDQKIWRDFCNNFGVLWFEVRDEHQFIKDLKERVEYIRNKLQN